MRWQRIGLLAGTLLQHGCSKNSCVSPAYLYMDTCVVDCPGGVQQCFGEGSSPNTPRPVAPLSGSVVSSRRPRMRWVPRGMLTGAVIDLCRDRAMGSNCQSLRVTGTSAVPTSELDAGTWFWRLRGVEGETVRTEQSSVWEFRVPSRSAPSDSVVGHFSDFNGDGFDDLAIGAPGEGSNGAVHVYLGSMNGPPERPTQSLTGLNANSGFGRIIAAGTDLNGDGYGDLVVGAPFEDLGAAYVFLGSPIGLTQRPQTRLTRVEEGPAYCKSAAMAGDVNGDGYGDLVIGNDYTVGSIGSVFVYLGSASGLAARRRVVIAGMFSDDAFGASVAGADVTGDGFADVLVGARASNNGIGKAYLYTGSAMGLVMSPIRFDSPSSMGTQFGSVVATGADLNGDGYSDIAISSPSSGTSPSRIYWYFGAQSFRSAPVAETPLTDQSGSIASIALRDLELDGFGDALVGLPSSSVSAGSAWLFRGREGGSFRAPDWTTSAAQADQTFGRAVSIADTSNDGHAELLVSDSSGVLWFFPSMGEFSAVNKRLLLAPAAGTTDFGAALASAELPVFTQFWSRN